MRVRAEQCTSFLRSARTLTPTPLSHGDYLRVAGGRGADVEVWRCSSVRHTQKESRTLPGAAFQAKPTNSYQIFTRCFGSR